MGRGNTEARVAENRHRKARAVFEVAGNSRDVRAPPDEDIRNRHIRQTPPEFLKRVVSGTIGEDIRRPLIKAANVKPLKQAGDRVVIAVVERADENFHLDSLSASYT